MVADDRQMQRLLDLLFFRFETDGISLFALLDAARDPHLYERIRLSGLEYECLFTGQLSQELLAASPYLIRITPDSRAFHGLLEQGWGQSWGLFLAARAGMYVVRRHLRRLLQIRTHEGKRLFFRFYDPRVLRVFLPTCDTTQLAQLFGPIRRFDMEAEDSSQLLRFRLIPEPSAPAALRSWTYRLSEQRDAEDDRGQIARV